MLLEVVNASKFYGARQALDGVSFKVARGEMAGILGGNGSGKSTVMRLLAGYFAPTNGRVRVGGQDPWKSAAIRQKIGYLPESTPLPPRQRVAEYLRYRGGLKGLSGRAEIRKALETVYESCRVEEFADRLIVHLNPNERQWVGIADCLLGNPEILLLDELTAGMDAHHADLAKRLVLSLSGDATILLTGRVLADMEGMCKRTVIMNGGHVMADGSLKNIIRSNVEERILVLDIVSAEPVREAFRAVPGVRTVTVSQESGTDGEKTVRIAVPPGVDLRQEFSQICARRGWLITGMAMEPVGLDDIFRKMTAGNAAR